MIFRNLPEHFHTTSQGHVHYVQTHHFTSRAENMTIDAASQCPRRFCFSFFQTPHPWLPNKFWFFLGLFHGNMNQTDTATVQFSITLDHSENELHLRMVQSMWEENPDTIEEFLTGVELSKDFSHATTY